MKLKTTFCAILVGLLCHMDSRALADTIVIRPKAWSGSLQSWIEYRQKQGHPIRELDADLDTAKLKQSIRDISKQEKIDYILLAGDVQASVPTFYHPSTALVQFGGPRNVASDNDYGDLDDDGSPDIAVGRVPAQNEKQLSDYLNRVIEYENNPDFSAWRRDVHVVAGVGGFGVVADSMIEMTTRKFLAETIPAWVNLSMTQASLSSHYCPDPLAFSESTLDRMNDGGAFWVYIGHGWIDQLDTIRVGTNNYPIMTAGHVRSVKTKHPPIAVFLACYTGAVDASPDCLAEQLILKESGPIAAIAASRVAGPYGLAVLSDGMLRGYYEQKIETIGSLVKEAKRASLDDARFNGQADAKSQLGMINSIASAMSPQGYDLKAERQEHVWQVNLLGDPLMKLAHSSELPIRLAADSVRPGQAINALIRCSKAGKLNAELSIRRGSVTDEVRQAKVDWQTDTGRQAYLDRYQAANRQTLVQAAQSVSSGEANVQLSIPENLKPGRYVLRVYLECDNGFEAGSCEVRVTPKESPSPN